MLENIELPQRKTSVGRKSTKRKSRDRGIYDPVGGEGEVQSLGEVHSGRVSTVVRDERGDVRGSKAELVLGGGDRQVSGEQREGENQADDRGSKRAVSGSRSILD